jgi:hypothetical protein
MPGDCAGPLKKEKLMVICAPSARRNGELRTSDLSPFPTRFRVSFLPSRKFSPKIDRIVFALDTKF